MYEWFLDCYRFQESSMDATNVEFHSPACGRLALLPFLLFCKLAQDRRVVPQNWNWRTFLSMWVPGRSPLVGLLDAVIPRSR